MVTVQQFFDGASRLPFGSLDQIAGSGGIVVVAPHPDDETLGCGGLIALAARAGRAVKIVVISDGCGSHPNSASHPPQVLRDLREQETRAAVATLGLDASQLAFLRLPDRFVPREGTDAENAAREIARAAHEIAATVILGTWRHDPHGDHQAAWHIATMARYMSPNPVALIAYPIWGWSLPPSTWLPVAPRGWRLDVKNVLHQKTRAISQHHSQISNLVENDPPVLVLAKETLARFEAPYEIYLEAEA